MKIFLLISFLLAASILSACSAASGALDINSAWARSSQMGQNGAIYFVIENGTNEDDTLISAHTDIASSTEIHMSMMDDQDVMSMQMQEAVQTPAGETVAFKTGGLHIMLISLNRDLKVGDTFTLTLQFQKAGEISLLVEVKEQ